MPDTPPTIEYATPYPPPRRRWLWWLVLVPVVLFLTLVMLRLMFRAAGSVQVTVTPVKVTAPPPPAPIAPSVPQRFTLAQRRQTPLAGTNGTVFIHIGDITGGRTNLTVQNATGVALLPPQSLGEGEIMTVPIAGTSFDVEVIEFEQHLTSDDLATLEVRRAGTPRATTRPATTRAAN